MTTTVERAPFQQADIAIEKPAEFEQLKAAFSRAFAAPAVERWLRLLKSRNVPVRDFHRVLREKLLEQSDRVLAQGGKTAQQLYDALTVSDQAQMREFYLSKLETVDVELRHKFKRLFQYY